MKLGNGIEAAIHCCAALAALEDEGVLSGADLARYHGLSPSYLLKHLNKLVGAGILMSVPGPSGGFRLARSADDITLADIVLTIEGREPAFRCENIRMRGPDPLPASAFPRPCGIQRAMLAAEAAYRTALAEVTLGALVKEYGETSEAEVIARGCAFLDSARRPYAVR